MKCEEFYSETDLIYGFAISIKVNRTKALQIYSIDFIGTVMSWGFSFLGEVSLKNLIYMILKKWFHSLN